MLLSFYCLCFVQMISKPGIAISLAQSQLMVGDKELICNIREGYYQMGGILEQEKILNT